jgi:signal peptidase I
MEVTFNTNGLSMLPLLYSGDSVTVKKAETYKKGDVVLFKRDDDSFVLHRIIKIKGDTVYTEGDALRGCDPPVKKENIIGKAVAFFRKGEKIKISDFKYKVYMLCYVSVFGKALRKIKRKIKRQ